MKIASLKQVWVYALFILCGRLWAYLPGWPPARIPLWLLRGFARGLAVIALQCPLSMVIRSFAVPILIALDRGIAGMLLLSKDAGGDWPYALMILGMNANRAEDMMNDMGIFFLSCYAFTIMDNDASPALGDVYTNEVVYGGLTELGAETIRECERLGSLVDLPHASDDTLKWR